MDPWEAGAGTRCASKRIQDGLSVGSARKWSGRSPAGSHFAHGVEGTGRGQRNLSTSVCAALGCLLFVSGVLLSVSGHKHAQRASPPAPSGSGFGPVAFVLQPGMWCSSPSALRVAHRSKCMIFSFEQPTPKPHHARTRGSPFLMTFA